jgi:hypothetical protein
MGIQNNKNIHEKTFVFFNNIYVICNVNIKNTIMIIYGSRDATLQSTSFEDHFCTNCGQKGTISCKVYSRHAHLFWIPLFPYSKRLVIWCNNCGKEFHINELNPQLQEEIKRFRGSCRAPFWQWVGLTLIVTSIILNIINVVTDNNNTKKYLHSPEINDVYCIENDDGYSLMYINEIKGDSVFFIFSDYTYPTISGVKKLHQLKYYDLDEAYGFSREELNKHYNDKNILKIWRSLPYSTDIVKMKESKTIDNSDVDEEDDDEDIDYQDDESEDSE